MWEGAVNEVRDNEDKHPVDLVKPKHSIQYIRRRARINCICHHFKHAHINYIGPCYKPGCPCEKFRKLA